MSDFWRWMPLSQRTPQDESAVTDDRRAALDEVLGAVLDLPLPGQSATERMSAVAHSAGLARIWSAAGGDVDRFRALLRARRCSIRTLSRAVAAALRLAREAARALPLDPMVAGAVALYAQAAGPFERRAVVRGHTVRATDADWAFGTGPVLEGPAVEVASFLLGVGDEPPQPPTAPGAQTEGTSTQP
ncbi:hypothetical protein GCM10009808_14130 [Microbacterium sediminicola]|uniref:Uncharacterized protein n=1 Tax=Microbacterium sediminicola TaxID=415210 RepID=A0ABP4U5L7_9MICO